MTLLSIIIPCFNEANNIPLILRRLHATLGKRQDIEVILVDNGSRDTSSTVLQKEISSYADTRFRTIRLETNHGYGHGILQGLCAARGDVLAWTHADMQTDPNDVLKAFDLYKSRSHLRLIVKGKRRNRRFLEAIFTFGMQCIAFLALKVKLDDINAQPKLFSRNFYETYIQDNAPHDFALDLFLLYKARQHQYEIVTFPVDFSKRLHGEAKGGGSFRTRLKLIRRTFSYIFQLKNKIKEESK